MSNTIQAVGNYKRKSDNKQVDFEFEYLEFTSLEEMVNELGEGAVHKLACRQYKVDAGNNAREKAKVANGDSTRVVLTEAEKAENKAKRAMNAKITAEARSNPEIAKLLADAGIVV